MHRDEEKRKAIIVAEIQKWRSSKLLPEPYLLFLLKLYGVFEQEALPPRPREKWFNFFRRFLPYIAVAIGSSVVTWLVFNGTSFNSREHVVTLLTAGWVYGGFLLPFLTILSAIQTTRFQPNGLERNVGGLIFVMMLMLTVLWINMWLPSVAPWMVVLALLIWLIAASWWRLLYHWALGLLALLLFFIWRLWKG
ncbi:MAG: hypothetical protein RBR24_08830 [Candidatus Carbobacillus sp.]|nr:hypothetical protein [Candidatus Carbobacillus sp.]